MTPLRFFRLERFYRLPIILGLLAVTALLAYRLSPRQTRLLLALLGTAAAAWFFLRWPPLGLAALIVAGLVVPVALGTGTQTSLNVTILLLPLLLALWGLDMVTRQQRLALLPARPLWPLLGLCVVATLAFMAGNSPWLAFAQTAPLRAQLGGLAVFWLSAGAFLLVAHQMRDLRWLQALTWLFLTLGGLYVAGRIVPGLGRFTGRLFQRGATGSLFWTWSAALAFGQAAFNRRLHPAGRLALGALVLAIFYLDLFQGRPWASGWLPPLVAVVAVLWAGAPRLGLPVTLVGGVLATLNRQRVLDAVLTADNQYSYITRLEAWRIVAEIVKANPVLGLGPANYYWYTPLFPILGWYVSFNSHNQYVDLVAQTGLLGLFFFLWFAWEVGRLGWRLRTRAPAGFARAYVYGCLGGLVGMLVAGMLADWVIPFVYNIGLAGFRASVLGWLFLGGLVALEQMVNRAETPHGRSA